MDRISYSFGMTIQTAPFEGVRIDINYETDVKTDETPKKALKRAQEFVESQVSLKVDEVKTAYGIGDSGDKEDF